MKRLMDIAFSVGIVFCSLFLLAQVPSFRDFLPANTIVGRLGIGPGPSQAIPFATLVSNLPLPTVGGTLPTAVTSFYVSTTGNDGNDCLSLGAPCLTIEHAIDLCNIGARCQINIGDGTYTTLTGYNVFYHRTIAFVGNCGNHEAVIINLAGNTLATFFVQDFAIGTIQCMMFTTNGINNTIVSARQLAIADLTDIVVNSAFVSGNIAAASTMASITLAGTIDLKFQPTMTSLVRSDFNSLVTLGASVVIQQSGGSFTAILLASGKSVINAQGATFSGAGAGTNTNGAQCTITDSTLFKPAGTIPGTTACATPIAANANTGAGYIP